MKANKYICLGRDKKTNDVKRLWRRKKNDGTIVYKWRQENPNPDAQPEWKCRFKKKSTAQEVKAWAEKEKNLAVYMSKDKYPFIVKTDGSSWGEPDLLKRLNKLGKYRRRYIRSGLKREPKHKGSSGANCGNCQHCFRMLYYNGTGNLAAECSSKYAGRSHSHAQCDAACRSHHCVGWAGDCSTYNSGRSGGYTNLGNDSKTREKMKKSDVKLVLNVGSEPWHCVPAHIDSNWKA